MPELIVFLRERELTRKPIMMAETTIGRDSTCDVVLDNAGVSRTHAVVLYNKGQFIIRDAGSQNGFTVNGREVSETQLAYGDVVGINKFQIHFSAEGGVPPELLESPKKPGGASPRNVVATMTINADAARKLQEQLLARKQPAAPQTPKPPPGAAARKGPPKQLLLAAFVLALATTAALFLR